jgi:dTDP-4-amino-4,6-dideoxygalactose transaminase
LGLSRLTFGRNVSARGAELAILGGDPIRTRRWHPWPVWNPNAELGVLEVLRSGRWWRGNGDIISRFEKEYARLVGAKFCLATASGTTALMTSLDALGVDAGDEVLVAPYTFIASYNAIFSMKALPVFVDTDIDTYTMNPDKIEERITERTRAVLPVHIYGLPADMDRINAIAGRHGLAVLEDACQAWLAEYRNQPCGTLGDLGCFSFQNSKNLPAGEGGAITGNDEALMDRCYARHDHGRPRGSVQGQYSLNGGNYRMQQFQASVLLSQIGRIERDARTRDANTSYLTSRLKDIPGILTLKFSEGATRSAYHVYPFRYQKEAFAGLPKRKFLVAMRAEGVPCGAGYRPPAEYGLIEEQLSSRGFQRLFSKQRLDEYREQLRLPDTERLCSEVVTLFQSMFLGNKRDMDDIANAILKIQQNAEKLAKS